MSNGASSGWGPLAAAAAAGAALGVLASIGYSQAASRTPARGAGGEIEERSTTSSAGGGTAAYETRKAVDEYLQFHFGADSDILPYPGIGPQSALSFTSRCALLCEKYSEAAADFTGERGDTLALDVGCAVGGASMELARAFTDVLGIDYSHAFVAAAQGMARDGARQYEAVLEGELRQTYTATVPTDIDRTRVRFMQGDACDLPKSLPQFDAVLAANLLCRLPDPIKFIHRLPSLVKPGGVAVLVSPYSWLAAWTPKSNWLGGQLDKDGKAQRSADVLAQLMTAAGFEMVHQEDVPFLIREHVRKFQWGCSHAVVWRRLTQ